MKSRKIGIIICDRYRRCAGGKCFRSVRNREGAFARYEGVDVEVAGFTTCDGCPGGNIEYTVDEMVANGIDVVHLATGMVVGYPPCPYIEQFHDYITTKYGLEVVYGTHPIPEKYRKVHSRLGTWDEQPWDVITEPTMTTEEIRLTYD